MQNVGDQDTTAAEAARHAEQQIALRRARQARVGLLRNPNRPPPPPVRRTPLIGRHLSLRSSRRPKAAPETAADRLAHPTDTADTPEAPLIQAEGGRIARIDVDRLERLAESLAPPPRPRRAFADSVLGGSATQAQADLAQNLRDTPAPAPGDSAAPPAPAELRATDGWRGLLSRWIGRI